ncbi:sulfite exporter TauE/SafE family protein [Cupriavidus consociatus]|uniref:sulfite exporter TauE/SafE family protein n=1 Tax=Cupriavidus consociatus TaxID=2821357 RepID=UPI001AE49FD4|nr:MULTISPECIES: sulfite exporter TauE/SafE family protein [unclassified Cupriavidus]MBP0621348.1 sulfite exporter TauE/SafE family protein [Cupriavidus sp. LEh25]MDK2658020.1 sulfite exporter TauE/SafE family protein [Cupriavidus sp. LEh21]
MSLAYTVSGLFVGVLVGLTGVGGGSLMTPLLTLLFGFSPATAVGTDLAFAAITKGFGTIAHRAHGHVQWQVVRRLCIGSLPAAVVAILVLKSAGELNAQWLHAIRVTIGVSVLLTVLSLLFRKQMLAWLERNPRFQLHGRKQVVATVVVGAVIGVLVTVSSIGAGAVGATLILLLYPHMKPAEVAGTDIAYAVPLTAIAGLGHVWLGTVNWNLLLALLVGSIPGIWLGAQLSRALPERLVRAALATTLTLVAIKLVS